MTLTVKNLSIGHYGYSDGIRNFIDGADSAGGISIKGSLVNNGEKLITYATLYLKPCDKSGDSVGCSVRRISKQGIDVEGPFHPGVPVEFFGESVWYNYSICSCVIIGADVEYEDGSTEHIAGDFIVFE